MAAASSHTHKYSNVSNQDSEVSQEPIYQNQAELRKQLQMLDKREPIYQNLPAHEKLMLLQEKKLQGTIHILRKHLYKGEFFSESAIRFLDLRISKKIFQKLS